jgi:hypothetical protein
MCREVAGVYAQGSRRTDSALHVEEDELVVVVVVVGVLKTRRGPVRWN